MQLHAKLCTTIRYKSIPCSTIWCQVIQWNNMHFWPKNINSRQLGPYNSRPNIHLPQNRRCLELKCKPMLVSFFSSKLFHFLFCFVDLSFQKVRQQGFTFTFPFADTNLCLFKKLSMRISWPEVTKEETPEKWSLPSKQSKSVTFARVPAALWRTWRTTSSLGTTWTSQRETCLWNWVLSKNFSRRPWLFWLTGVRRG